MGKKLTKSRGISPSALLTVVVLAVVCAAIWYANRVSATPGPAPTPTPEPTPMPEFSFPYPEQPVDPSITAANIDTASVVREFLSSYFVPAEYWSFWESIPFQLLPNDITQYPAYMKGFSGHMILRVYIQPQFFNPGVLAHEFDHVCYENFLSPSQQAEFDSVWRSFLSEPSMNLLYANKAFLMQQSGIEAHSEIYRFLGDQMPSGLRQYFPRLVS